MIIVNFYAYLLDAEMGSCANIAVHADFNYFAAGKLMSDLFALPKSHYQSLLLIKYLK